MDPDTSSAPSHATGRPLRAVIADLESVVRTTQQSHTPTSEFTKSGLSASEPIESGVAAADPFVRWLELPDDEWVIVSDRVRNEHAGHAVPPAEALAALLAFADGTNVVVAYNGFAADFPLLAEACDREGLQRLPGEYVDAYYLTLAMWPTAATHRLAHLAAAVGVPTGNLSWHNATADCLLLGRLLAASAAKLGRWPEPLRDLIASAVPDSPGWRLLRELAADGLAGRAGAGVPAPRRRRRCPGRPGRTPAAPTGDPRSRPRCVQHRHRPARGIKTKAG